MIERFNFYDIYGYLIPGALLIVLIALPHLLIGDLKLTGDVSAALVALIGAYVAGHILQTLAHRTIPTNANKHNRFPSDRMLDDEDPTFPIRMKMGIASAIRRQFALDVSDSASRGEAFFLCRDALIAAKTTSYVEQFQGMYVLMRGISAAAAIGAAYDIGWLCGPLVNGEYRDVVASSVLFVLGILVAFRMENRTVYGALLLLGVVTAGVLAGGGRGEHVRSLLATAGLSLLVSIWAFGAYQAFAFDWARTVYRDFYLLTRPSR